MNNNQADLKIGSPLNINKYAKDRRDVILV